MDTRLLLRAALTLVLALAFLGLPAVTRVHAQAHPSHGTPGARGAAGQGRAAIPALRGGVQVVEVRVGAAGFEPARIALRAGVRARLVFTRTARSTCAVQVEVPAYGVPKTDLPLGRPVAVEFTPRASGEFAFACGMGMERGALLVRR